MWWSPCLKPLLRSPPVGEAGSCSKELKSLSKWLKLSLHLGERIPETNFLFSRWWRENSHHCCWVLFCKFTWLSMSRNDTTHLSQWVHNRGRQCWKSVSLTCQPIFKTKMKRCKIKISASMQAKIAQIIPLFLLFRIHNNTKWDKLITTTEQQNQNWPELEDASFTRSPLK